MNYQVGEDSLNFLLGKAIYIPTEHAVSILACKAVGGNFIWVLALTPIQTIAKFHPEQRCFRSQTTRSDFM